MTLSRRHVGEIDASLQVAAPGQQAVTYHRQHQQGRCRRPIRDRDDHGEKSPNDLFAAPLNRPHLAAQGK